MRQKPRLARYRMFAQRGEYGLRGGRDEWPARRCRGPTLLRSPDPRHAGPSARGPLPPHSYRADPSASSAPQRTESSRRAGMVSVATIVAPVRFNSMVNIKPMGPCPMTTAVSSGLRRALDNGLQTRIDRFHERWPAQTRHRPEFFPHRPRRSSPLRARTERSRRRPAQIRRSRRLSCRPGIGRRVSAGNKSSSGKGCGETRPRGRRAQNGLQPAPSAHHNACSLMSIDARRGQKVVFDFLEIGMADSAGFHAHENFAWSDFGNGHLLHARRHSGLCIRPRAWLAGYSSQNRQPAMNSPNVRVAIRQERRNRNKLRERPPRISKSRR